MKKVYAVWDGKRTTKYITPKKKYAIFPSPVCDFSINADDGYNYDCWWKGCAHIDGGNWTRIEEDEEAPQTEQKTLRDEFAMAALTGLLASESTASYETFARVCYEIADAMLEARKK